MAALFERVRNACQMLEVRILLYPLPHINCRYKIFPAASCKGKLRTYWLHAQHLCIKATEIYPNQHITIFPETILEKDNYVGRHSVSWYGIFYI